MFRISGAVALILSAALAVLLYSRVRSTDIVAKSWGFENGTLLLRCPSPELGDWLQLEGMDPAAAEIPNGADVDFRLRQLALPELFGIDSDWDFEAMRITSGGRTYAFGRRISMFYTILGLASLTPLVLWSIAAVAVLALRRSRQEAALKGR